MQNSEQNLYNNLIRQIDRYKHYCHEGSYKTRERYYNSCKRFCEFLAVEFRVQKFLNVNEKHIKTAQGKKHAEKWVALIRKYTDLTELTAPLLNELIEKIVVHEATKDENGKRTQELDIYYRFIGKIDG